MKKITIIKKEENKEASIGDIICHKYQLTTLLNQGSFGKIYACKHINTGDIYAVKIERVNKSPNAIQTLTKEAEILIDLKGATGFPRLQYFLKDTYNSCLVMTLLTDNLEQLFNRYQKLTLQTVIHLANQMLLRIEYLHYNFIVHRDIKPENFCMGGKGMKDSVFLVDFGLARKFINDKKIHIPFRQTTVGMIGTSRYTSINSHLGNEQSRRDDLESMGYVLVYLVKGKLPWMNLDARNKEDLQRKILEGKVKGLKNWEFCEGLPEEFKKYFQHIKSLKFTDEPNYNYLKKLFRTLQLKLQSQQSPLSFN